MSDHPSSGVPEAFLAMAMTHLGDVARFARWLTRNESEADDLVQDTYLQALRGWPTFRPGSDGRAWLLTICRNCHRSRQRRASRIESVDTAELEALATVDLFEEATARGLQGMFEGFDLRDAIVHSLRALPEIFRDVIVLVDVQDLSYDAAATLLGIPPGTLRSRLYRGRKLLQQRLLAHARDLGLDAAPTRDDARENG